MADVDLGGHRGCAGAMIRPEVPPEKSMTVPTWSRLLSMRAFRLSRVSNRLSFPFARDAAASDLAACAMVAARRIAGRTNRQLDRRKAGRDRHAGEYRGGKVAAAHGDGAAGDDIGSDGAERDLQLVEIFGRPAMAPEFAAPPKTDVGCQARPRATRVCRDETKALHRAR